MTHRLLLLLVLVAGCKTGGNDGAAADASVDDAQSGRDAADDGADPACESFEPRAFDTTCTVDSDCVVTGALLPGASQCEIPCCDAFGVRNTAAVRAARDAVTSCCKGYVTCAKECPGVFPKCNQGTCAAVLDAGSPDADAADAAPDADAAAKD